MGYKVAWVVSLALLGGAAAGGAATMAAGVPGSFVYTQAGYFADKPVTVFYYRPTSAGPDAQVLFTMHGAERDGKLALEPWMSVADKLGVILVAPEFDNRHYPNALYQIAGIDNSDVAERPSTIIAPDGG